MLRRLFKLSTLMVVGSVALAAPTTLPAQSSHTKEAYTDARFAELQKSGALILVDVWAEWCSTCAQQQRVLEAFRQEHPDVKLHTLTVDWDKQKDAVRKFAAPRQSTLILYRGTERLEFWVAEVRAEQLVPRILAAAEGS